MNELVETIIEETESSEIIEVFEDGRETVDVFENVMNESDPTVPSWVKNITQEEIDNWNNVDLSSVYTKEEIDNKGFLTQKDIENIPRTHYSAGENINITDEGVISVMTAPNVEKDNTKPITSSAVYTEVGNIKVLLETI